MCFCATLPSAKPNFLWLPNVLEQAVIHFYTVWSMSMPASFVRLFLVRHAEAMANPEMRYLGSRDDPLTERGQWQALQLAHALAPLALAAVYTSPLTRAVATAMPIADAHGMSIISEPRLVEAAMGT